MSTATNNPDASKSDCSKTGIDTTVTTTSENQSSVPESGCFEAHQANPGPVVPQNTTNLKEEGTLEERLSKAKELNK